MESQIGHWTSDDFIILLYINSIADNYNISEDEHSKILSRISVNQYKYILKYYIKYTKKEIQKRIKYLAEKHYSTSSQKEKINERIVEFLSITVDKSNLNENIIKNLNKII